MASRALSTSAEEILPRNKLRKSWIMQNEDSAIAIFIKLEAPGTSDVSSTVHDHRLAAGGNLSVSLFTDGKDAVQARWTAVAASGTPRLSFFETEEIDRSFG